MRNSSRRGGSFRLLAVTLFAATLLAQGERGTITGTITDSTGAVVPAATVTVRNIATGVTFRGVSSESGQVASGNVDGSELQERREQLRNSPFHRRHAEVRMVHESPNLPFARHGSGNRNYPVMSK